MYSFHADKKRYFEMQRLVTQDDVIPFIEEKTGILTGKRILEIGCAEAGVLKAFIDKGNIGVGVELSESRFQSAEINLSDDIRKGNAFLSNKNIYDITSPAVELGGLFDLIILKDVIEHIPDQQKFITTLKSFLLPGGFVFFAYPPWWMPFGGHQQICKNKLLQRLPWFHLLPGFLYTAILKVAGESIATQNELQEIKNTGVLIEAIKKYIKKAGFRQVHEKYWLVNPIYTMKFGLKKRALSGFLTDIPFVRNIYTTAHYLLFQPEVSDSTIS